MAIPKSTVCRRIKSRQHEVGFDELLRLKAAVDTAVIEVKRLAVSRNTVFFALGRRGDFLLIAIVVHVIPRLFQEVFYWRNGNLSAGNPFSFFDEIQCISCDYHPDRWGSVTEQFRRVGIDDRVARFSATENDRKYGIERPAGKIRGYATSLCHREIVKSAKARNLDNVLIFEDDVSFLTDDLRDLSDAIVQLEAMPGWQLFFLGMNVRSFGLEKISKNLLFGEQGRPAKICSTHAYAIHHSAFDRVLTYAKDGFSSNIDVWLPENIDFFCLDPLFSVQDQGRKASRFQRQFRRFVVSSEHNANI